MSILGGAGETEKTAGCGQAPWSKRRRVASALRAQGGGGPASSCVWTGNGEIGIRSCWPAHGLGTSSGWALSSTGDSGSETQDAPQAPVPGDVDKPAPLLSTHCSPFPDACVLAAWWALGKQLLDEPTT